MKYKEMQWNMKSRDRIENDISAESVKVVIVENRQKKSQKDAS